MKCYYCDAMMNAYPKSDKYYCPDCKVAVRFRNKKLYSITWEECLILPDEMGAVRIDFLEEDKTQLNAWLYKDIKSNINSYSPFLSLYYVPPDWTPHNIQDKLKNLLAFL